MRCVRCNYVQHELPYNLTSNLYLLYVYQRIRILKYCIDLELFDIASHACG